jgi:3-oxoacyl-[acyl-carrier protein] reductase
MTPDYRKRLDMLAEKSGRSFSQQMDHETSNVPLGKYAEPEEAANAIAMLLSQFSDHMTGANVVVDGGFTRAY